MQEKVNAIIDILKQRYPEAPCALHYGKDYELMIAVRLSAQCTDARVNLVTPALFEAYPTLEAMAVSLGLYEGHVCACMDARRNQVYNALFLADGGVAERFSEDRAIALADLKTKLEHIDGPIYLVGDGSQLTYKTLSGEIPNLILPPEHRMHQRAVGVAILAERKQAAGESGNGNALSPNYLRLSQAERERAEKMQKNQ